MNKDTLVIEQLLAGYHAGLSAVVDRLEALGDDSVAPECDEMIWDIIGLIDDEAKGEMDIETNVMLEEWRNKFMGLSEKIDNIIK